MEFLKQRLSQRDSKRQYEAYLHQLLRDGHAAQLEVLLNEGFRRFPSAYSQACVRITEAAIQIEGWDELLADMVRFENQGHNITAVGVDVSGHHDGIEPALETSLYSDQPYPFSTSSLEAISEECLNYSSEWRGAFIECSYWLSISGFSPLLELNESHRKQNKDYYSYNPQTSKTPMPADYPGRFLVDWFIYLRVYQALTRELESKGLIRPLPVILGEHDFGPHVGVVIECKKSADHQARTQEIFDQREALKNKRIIEHTTKRIEEFRSNRDFVKKLPKVFRNDKQKKAGAYFVAMFQSDMKMSGIAIKKPLDKMSDREFEGLMDTFRAKKLKGI